MNRFRDLPNWPHADLSRFVRHRPHDWHVQEAGTGDTVRAAHRIAGAT